MTRSRSSALKVHDNQDGHFKFQSVQQQYDRFQNLAREALTTGDRIMAEGYYQHAEHYLRVLNGLKPSAPVTSIVEADPVDIEDVMRRALVNG